MAYQTLDHSFFRSQSHFVRYMYEMETIHHEIFLKENLYILGRCLYHKQALIENGINPPIDEFVEEAKSKSETLYADLLYSCITSLNFIINRYTDESDIQYLRKKLPIENFNTNQPCDFSAIYDRHPTLYPSSNSRIFTKDFMNLVKSLKNKFGLYFLYDNNNNLIYVGRSQDLHIRIQSSAEYRKANYCKILKLNNKCECSILEPYYISLLNPPLNIKLKSEESPSFKIDHKFEFSQLIKIHNE
jgi:hypothetical protein